MNLLKICFIHAVDGRCRNLSHRTMYGRLYGPRRIMHTYHGCSPCRGWSPVKIKIYKFCTTWKPWLQLQKPIGTQYVEYIGFVFRVKDEHVISTNDLLHQQLTITYVATPETPKTWMFPNVCIRCDDNRTMTTNIISKINDGRSIVMKINGDKISGVVNIS